MKLLLKNSIWPLTLSLNLLKICGILVPGNHTERKKILLQLYGTLWFTYMTGIYVIIQAGDLFQIWGNLPMMVSTSFLLFTNLAFGMKVFNVMVKRDAVQAIIDDGDDELAAENTVEGIRIVKRCNQETSRHLHLYFLLSGLTVLGLAASAEKGGLPVRAWYPYDTSTSPMYEITYFHQVSAIFVAASLNVSMDTLVTSLIAICRCRLRLLNLSLSNLCTGTLERKNDEMHIKEEVALLRLKDCVRRHQAVLWSANEIQRCFSEPILAQFAVSMVIICVTAYQLATELNCTPMNVVRIVGMSAYLFCMTLQVFLYCYQGNQLLIEGSEIASAAYSCPWYLCSVRFRRTLLVVMIRSKRDTQLSAGGFTTLSLTCFTAIVKASYTFFTVLQRVEDRRK